MGAEPSWYTILLSNWSSDDATIGSLIMDLTILKAQIERCGLRIIRTKVHSEGNFVQLFIDGGPIVTVYQGEKLRLAGNNLELMEGVFGDNFEISRAISRYKEQTKDMSKYYNINARTKNHFVCRDVAKAIRNLNVRLRVRCKKKRIAD